MEELLMDFSERFTEELSKIFFEEHENKGHIGKHHSVYIYNTGDDIYEYTGDWGYIEAFKMTASKIHLL